MEYLQLCRPPDCISEGKWDVMRAITDRPLLLSPLSQSCQMHYLHLGHDGDGSRQRIRAAGVQQSEELHFLLISWQVCAYLSLFDFVTGVSSQHPSCHMKMSSLFYAYHMSGGLCLFLLNMNFATIPWACVSWRLDDCCHRAVLKTCLSLQLPSSASHFWQGISFHGHIKCGLSVDLHWQKSVYQTQFLKPVIESPAFLRDALFSLRKPDRLSPAVLRAEAEKEILY